MPISFVGYATATLGSSTASTYNISLTALTGGSDSSPSANDVVVVLSGWSSLTDDNPGVTSPTATEVADLYANDNNDTNMSAAYFVCGTTPPTSVTVSAKGAVADGNVAVAAVFRGVDTTTPIDVTTTTATGTGGSSINSPTITPTTTGAWALTMGITAKQGAVATGMTAPSGYTLAGGPGIAGNTRAANGGFAYKSGMTSGVAEDPGAFTMTGGGGAGASWCAATIVLRPQQGQIKWYNGSSWVAKPMKIWNGSAWVQKPVKFWNGSAWVKTNY